MKSLRFTTNSALKKSPKLYGSRGINTLSMTWSLLPNKKFYKSSSSMHLITSSTFLLKKSSSTALKTKKKLSCSFSLTTISYPSTSKGGSSYIESSLTISKKFNATVLWSLVLIPSSKCRISNSFDSYLSTKKSTKGASLKMPSRYMLKSLTVIRYTTNPC